MNERRKRRLRLLINAVVLMCLQGRFPRKTPMVWKKLKKNMAAYLACSLPQGRPYEFGNLNDIEYEREYRYFRDNYERALRALNNATRNFIFDAINNDFLHYRTEWTNGKWGIVSHHRHRNAAGEPVPDGTRCTTETDDPGFKVMREGYLGSGEGAVAKANRHARDGEDIHEVKVLNITDERRRRGGE